ncbi:MAG: hypothetical protein VZQ80_05165 [Lachnospiraceae bacterium]|nr:hypothetical protein [Lachnospiraceae bacterium]
MKRTLWKRLAAGVLSAVMVASFWPAAGLTVRAAEKTKLTPVTNVKVITTETDGYYPYSVVFDHSKEGTLNQYQLEFYDGSFNKPRFSSFLNYNAADQGITRDDHIAMSNLEAGHTYLFEIKTLALGYEDEYEDSEVVTGSFVVANFTKGNLPTIPADAISWDGKKVTVDTSKIPNYNTIKEVCGFDLEYMYKGPNDSASKKVGGVGSLEPISKTCNPDESGSAIYTVAEDDSYYKKMLANNGEGEYSVRIRFISFNENYQDGAFSEESPIGSRQNLTEKVKTNLDSAVTKSSGTAEEKQAAIKTVKDQGADNLLAVMEADKDNTGVTSQIETIEKNTGKTAEVSVSDDVKGLIETPKVIGAGLNASGDAKVVMNVSKPAKEVMIPALYKHAVQVDFSLSNADTTNDKLAVPVKITMPVPGTIRDAEKLVILHYHGSDKKPVEVGHHVFTKDGVTYCSFVVDRFSTFVFAEEKTAADSGENDNPSNNSNSGWYPGWPYGWNFGGGSSSGSTSGLSGNTNAGSTGASSSGSSSSSNDNNSTNSNNTGNTGSGYVYVPHGIATTVVYRLYDRSRGEHIYTTSEGEKDALVKAGWAFEGVSFRSAVSGGTPVYRLYNKNNGGMHFYTASASERDSLAKNGWKDEGVAFNATGSVPVYRIYNPNSTNGEHHYTTVEGEVNHLTSIGWKNEGIAWYTAE